MSTSPQTLKQIEDLVKGNKVMLFMKGNRNFPQCGFSATVVQILGDILDDYQTFNVLEDPAIRAGIKEYAQWPTIPQLYVDGEFIGGCDIIKQMSASGDQVFITRSYITATGVTHRVVLVFLGDAPDQTSAASIWSNRAQESAASCSETF